VSDLNKSLPVKTQKLITANPVRENPSQLGLLSHQPSKLALDSSERLPPTQKSPNLFGQITSNSLKRLNFTGTYSNILFQKSQPVAKNGTPTPETQKIEKFSVQENSVSLMEAKSPAPKLDLTGVDRKIFFWFFGMEFWLGILLPLQKNLNCNF
jgi:hypothetical protein